MNQNDKAKSGEVLIVRSHVESRGSLRVVRLEPSKLGKRTLTSTSSGISAAKPTAPEAWHPPKKEVA